METSYRADPPRIAGTDAPIEATKSAVSWAAILAGSVAAVAATLILLVLGSGLGFVSVSPWHHGGASATTLGALAGVWFIVVQWLSAGIGGYLTGRLRTKWVGTHTHEVFFRDTTHGFVTWAVATLVLAIMLGSAVSATMGTGVRAAATMGSGAAQGATSSAQRGPAVGAYDVDMLFRSAHPDTKPAMTDGNAEATRILEKGLSAGDVPAADRSSGARPRFCSGRNLLLDAAFHSPATMAYLSASLRSRVDAPGLHLRSRPKVSPSPFGFSLLPPTGLFLPFGAQSTLVARC